MVKWVCPPMDVVKVNVNGASKGSLGYVGCGCVLRNHEGQWVMGAARNLGCCTSQKAELWGVLLGLQTAWRYGCRKIILETDSAIVHDLLMNHNVLESDNLPPECRRLLDLDWSVQVQKVYIEANYVAGGIATWVLSQEIWPQCLVFQTHQ